MCGKKYALILPLLAVLLAVSWMAQPASAETEYGKDFDRTLLSVNPDRSETFLWQSAPERIIDHHDWNGKPVYANYKLYQDSSIVKLETMNSGSLVFQKNSCTYSLYAIGEITPNDSPKIKNIKWDVRGKLSSASTWSNVTSINNAVCATSVTSSFDTVIITGTKSNAAGIFQIELKYVAGKGIKETMRAYNNNPAWTNHNIGFTESFEVPRIIHFGNQTYDLATKNNTTLNRNWIGNNTNKLIDLSNNILYGFGLGWTNLNDIKINWDDTKARLSLNYLYPSGIVPYQQWFEVDPTFGYTSATHYRIYTDGATATCETTLNAVKATDFNLNVGKEPAAAPGAGACNVSTPRWNISSIPTGSSVNSTKIRYDVQAIGNPVNCQWNPMQFDPSGATSAQQLFLDALNGTTMKSNDSSCVTVSNNKIVDLGSSGATDVQSHIAGGWYSVGIADQSHARDGLSHSSTADTSGTYLIELQVVYVNPPPYAVTTLSATPVSTTQINLAWTQPNLRSGTLQGYQINYTTPYGIPHTIYVNNTGTSAITRSVTGLTLNTPYSFRVAAWTEGGTNATGNIANATTLAFNQANYTIGSFNYNANNPLLLPIRYERINVNSSHTLVNVTFSNTINLACDLRYTYAGTNHTYHTIPSSAISSSERESSFRLINATNEIVTFRCWNQAGNQSANYVLTQTNFLLLQQVHDFRNGTYGTMGQLGAFDFITLIVVIIAMIGLNRNTPTVGGIFCLIAISVITYFGIISWVTAIVSAAAVILMLIIASTRKIE